MFECAKRGIRELFRNKLRFFLTVGGITIGVLSVILISALGETGKSLVNSKLVSMGLDSIVVSMPTGSENGLNENDISKIENINGIKKAIPLMNTVASNTLKDKTSECMIWGVNENANDVVALDILHGRLINKGDVASKAKVCLIDEELARNAYKRSNIVGKKINVVINGMTCEFEVVGVVKNGVNVLQSMLGNIIPAFVYIPYTTFQYESQRDNFDQIAVKLYDSQTDVSSKIKQTVQAEKNSNVIVENLVGQKDVLSGILNIITIVLTIIGGISLIVSGLSIMTVMMVSVSERTREIGIKKSIGASKKDIMMEFLVESALITITGSLIGVAAGTAVSALTSLIIGSQIVVSFSLIAILFLFTLALGITFGLYPACKAASLNPVDALHM